MEIWKPVVGFDMYEVSSLGRVRSVRMMSQAQTHGYAHLDICRNGKKSPRRVHRLVAEAFLGNLDGMTVNHKNGDSMDNRLENLEIISLQDNLLHSRMVLKRGLRNAARLNETKVKEIRRLKKIGKNTNEIAEQFCVSTSTIRQIAAGTIWKGV